MTCCSRRPWAGIERLNSRYSSSETRTKTSARAKTRRAAFTSSIAAALNQAEGKWMGWERKRGKLHELNRLLRGAAEYSFHRADGDPAGLPGVRYVITLEQRYSLRATCAPACRHCQSIAEASAR